MVLMSPTNAPTVDLDEAQRFLDWLDPDADFFTFQTFPDRRKAAGAGFIQHGTLMEKAPDLIRMNKRADGVFITINATDRCGRAKANISRVRALYLDLDGAPVESVMACEQPPHVVVESSPGKFHCYWAVDGVPKHAAEQYLAALIARFDGDPACKDCSRVLRLPGFIHRKNVPFRTRIIHFDDQMPLKPDVIEAELCKVTARTEAQIDERDPLFRDVESGRVDWKEIDKALKGKSKGSWHSAMTKAAASMMGHGVPDDLIIEILMHYRWQEYSDGETRREISTAIDGARRRGFGIKIEPVLGDQWRAGLIYGQRGPASILENAVTALRTAPEWSGALALNELSNRVVYKKPPPFATDPGPQWLDRDFDEHDDARVACWMQRANIKVGHELAGKAVATVASEARTNPLQDYLRRLQWDGTPRVEDWLTRHLGVADSTYTQAVARCTLIAAVARAFRPGCKADHMLVLIGNQGLGKSSAVLRLARGWYTSSVPDLRSKDAMIQVQGAWICEMEELESFRATKDVTAIKSFLSRQTDQFRPPYGRTIVDVPRRCIFIGTTNEAEIFADGTGNRRFWPVECTKHADLELLDLECDQLWAEAVVLYEAGEPWHITDAEIQAHANREQESRVQVIDAWVELLADRLGTATSTTSKSALVDHLGFEYGRITRRDEMEVSRALRRLGFTKTHSKYGKLWKKTEI